MSSMPEGTHNKEHCFLSPSHFSKQTTFYSLFPGASLNPGFDIRWPKILKLKVRLYPNQNSLSEFPISFCRKHWQPPPLHNQFEVWLPILAEKNSFKILCFDPWAYLPSTASATGFDLISIFRSRISFHHQGTKVSFAWSSVHSSGLCVAKAQRFSFIWTPAQG